MAYKRGNKARKLGITLTKADRIVDPKSQLVSRVIPPQRFVFKRWMFALLLDSVKPRKSLSALPPPPLVSPPPPLILECKPGSLPASRWLCAALSLSTVCQAEPSCRSWSSLYLSLPVYLRHRGAHTCSGTQRGGAPLHAS